MKTGIALALLLSLNACAIPMAVPVALSAMGGAVGIAKDVLDIDVAWHQQTPTKPAKLIRWTEPPL